MKRLLQPLFDLSDWAKWCLVALLIGQYRLIFQKYRDVREGAFTVEVNH